MLQAHQRAGEAYIAWFEGNEDKAAKRASEAERLAIDETCPWVLYAIARLRAHMLKAAGRTRAARDQACIAEVLASEHGAVTRARWIREELDLDPPGAAIQRRAS